MLATLAGANMFQNRMLGFIPNMGAPTFHPGVMPAIREGQPAATSANSVNLADIYQAAKTRAVEEHELDKLFNPDFFNYEI